MKKKHKLLAKFRGMLVVMEVTIGKDKEPLTCKDCGSKKFMTLSGWITCRECGFAILETDYNRIKKELDNVKNL